MEAMTAEEMLSLLEPESSPAKKIQSSQEETKSETGADVEKSGVDVDGSSKLLLEDSSDEEDGAGTESHIRKGIEASNKEIQDSINDDSDEEEISGQKKSKKRAVLDDSSDSEGETEVKTKTRDFDNGTSS